ncbi:hypothetical protein H1R20_g12144, partial [Candolleomyces eurysporus]
MTQPSHLTDLWQARPLQDFPQMSTQTFLGIVVAISGNTLISFALNLQKLAHKRMQQRRRMATGVPKHSSNHIEATVPEEPDEEDQQAQEHEREQEQDRGQASATATLTETQPLMVLPVSRDYGAATTPASAPAIEQSKPRRTFVSRLLPFRFRARKGSTTAITLPIDIVTEEAALHALSSKNQKNGSTPGEVDQVEDTEGDYLKSKSWWLGFLLMNVGEVGNFISYAFAPASVVAPLGTFALIANCFFAPLMLGEKFRKRDLLGVLIAMIGAVTVVLASNASDTRLDIDGLIHAICQLPFIAFSIVYLVGVVVLAGLSETPLGRRWVFIDVGLCALFGGFTVLSTKALSTLLTLHWIEVFAEWITYPLIFVLFATGIGQIRYLNRALMRFDSKRVIPIQFVFFTLSAIIGSAILYGDFKKAKFHQVVTFLYGCAATFAGVFVIAWAPQTAQDDLSEGGEGSAITPGSPEQARLAPSTAGRRRRPTLVLPSGVNALREAPGVRRKRSTIGMAISPAQHLLLVHTPPRDVPLSQSADDDLGDTDTELGIPSPESYGRRRTMSWYGNEAGTGTRTRDSSLTGRRQNGYGRTGSVETFSANR